MVKKVEAMREEIEKMGLAKAEEIAGLFGSIVSKMK